jgi:hypothetical protein
MESNNKNKTLLYGFTIGMSLILLYWAIFNRVKFLNFVEKVKNGMSHKYAYKAVKNNI